MRCALYLALCGTLLGTPILAQTNVSGGESGQPRKAFTVLTCDSMVDLLPSGH